MSETGYCEGTAHDDNESPTMASNRVYGLWLCDECLEDEELLVAAHVFLRALRQQWNGLAATPELSAHFQRVLTAFDDRPAV